MTEQGWAIIACLIIGYWALCFAYNAYESKEIVGPAIWDTIATIASCIFVPIIFGVSFGLLWLLNKAFGG